MAQFQVYRLGDSTLVLDLQSNVIDTGTRVVAPLIPVTKHLQPLSILEPVFQIDGIELALHTGELAAIPDRHLKFAPVADLTTEDYAIRRALDMLFSGF